MGNKSLSQWFLPVGGQMLEPVKAPIDAINKKFEIRSTDESVTLAVFRNTKFADAVSKANGIQSIAFGSGYSGRISLIQIVSPYTIHQLDDSYRLLSAFVDALDEAGVVEPV